MPKRKSLKFTVVLTRRGGELARETVTVPEHLYEMDEAINIALQGVIETWLLSPGDSIQIQEG